MEAYSADWQRPVSRRSPVCELRVLPASCQEPLPFAACVPEEKEDITIKASRAEDISDAGSSSLVLAG